MQAGHNIASMVAMYDWMDFRRLGPPPNNGANPTLGFYGADLLPMELMFVKSAGDVLKERTEALEYFLRVEAMTDWYYGALARRLACMHARDVNARTACLAEMMSQPIMESDRVVNLKAVRRMDASTNGFAGYLSRLFPPLSPHATNVPLLTMMMSMD